MFPAIRNNPGHDLTSLTYGYLGLCAEDADTFINIINEHSRVVMTAYAAGRMFLYPSALSSTSLFAKREMATLHMFYHIAMDVFPVPMVATFRRKSTGALSLFLEDSVKSSDTFVYIGEDTFDVDATLTNVVNRFVIGGIDTEADIILNANPWIGLLAYGDRFRDAKRFSQNSFILATEVSGPADIVPEDSAFEFAGYLSPRKVLDGTFHDERSQVIAKDITNLMFSAMAVPIAIVSDKVFDAISKQADDDDKKPMTGIWPDTN